MTLGLGRRAARLWSAVYLLTAAAVLGSPAAAHAQPVPAGRSAAAVTGAPDSPPDATGDMRAGRATPPPDGISVARAVRQAKEKRVRVSYRPGGARRR